MADREFDVVLFGASGFVGRLVAEQLAGYAAAGTTFGPHAAAQSNVRCMRVWRKVGGAGGTGSALTATVGSSRHHASSSTTRRDKGPRPGRAGLAGMAGG